MACIFIKFKEFLVGIIPIAFLKYFDFKGCSNRAEYFHFILFNIVVFSILTMLDFSLMNSTLLSIGGLGGIYSWLTIIPSISVLVRRLHDTNRSGWWGLIIFIPLIGFFVLFIFVCLKGKSDENKYINVPAKVAI